MWKHCWALLLCAQTAAAQPAPAFDPERIREHLKILADDSFEGRAPGLPGGHKTEEYLAAQFAAFGLQPAGDHGTYFQNVPLVGVTTRADTQLSLQTNAGLRALTLGEHIALNNPSLQEHSAVDAPIVFVGFGITAPEYGWDDYKGVDMKGKIALLFVNEPQADAQLFKGPALTYYGRWTYKFEEAARQGAVGAIIIHRTDLASYGWEVVRNSWGGEQGYLRADTHPRVTLASWVDLETARRLANESGKDLDQMFQAAQRREFRPIELSARLQGSIHSAVRSFNARNVIGKVAGSDPARRAEAVLYTAHHDHLGVDPDVPGPDKIYNGALDNASGCAVLLELARAWSSAAPPRSLYFVATTAEEQGLLGAAHLALHPPVPVGKIALDINFDMLPALGEPEEIQAAGSERTTFAATVQQVAAEMKLQLRADPHPESGLYYRMDHFRLAQQGIPAFTVAEGLQFRGRTRAWGEAQLQDYVGRRYHQPADEYSSDWDFTGLATVARFSYLLGQHAATRAGLVQWLPGDEFEAARRRSQNP